MASNNRHGRKIPLPSTRQIRHELLVMADQDAARLRLADKAREAQVVTSDAVIGE